jgi:hypothetical protein
MMSKIQHSCMSLLLVAVLGMALFCPSHRYVLEAFAPQQQQQQPTTTITGSSSPSSTIMMFQSARTIPSARLVLPASSRHGRRTFRTLLSSSSESESTPTNVDDAETKSIPPTSGTFYDDEVRSMGGKLSYSIHIYK